MREERGFTLAEVLAALLITGLVVSVAAQTLTWQAGITNRGKSTVEIEQACRAAFGLVEREIRQGKLITLVKPGVLQITRSNNQIIKLYVADKDYNGINDLYLETDGVPNPVASYIEEINFTQLNRAWRVDISAGQRGMEIRWEMVVNQRRS